eukprot:gene12102-13751_t
MTFNICGGVANRGYKDIPVVSVLGECQHCFHPICAEMICNNSGANNVNVGALLVSAMQQSIDLRIHQFEILQIWPEQAESDMPSNLPENVKRAFIQGERNFFARDCEEASATMYRRCLDLGLKIAFPDIKGDLNKRIRKLVEDHVLPGSIGEWAHQVRLVGNDGAHDDQGVTKEDLKVCRNFVDAVLRYTFSFPKMVEERRAASANSVS